MIVKYCTWCTSSASTFNDHRTSPSRCKQVNKLGVISLSSTPTILHLMLNISWYSSMSQYGRTLSWPCQSHLAVVFAISECFSKVLHIGNHRAQMPIVGFNDGISHATIRHITITPLHKCILPKVEYTPHIIHFHFSRTKCWLLYLIHT